jgi:hypothetical protein
MRGFTVSPLARLTTGGLIGLALLGGAATSQLPTSQLPTARLALGADSRIASAAPHGAVGRLSAARASAAAQGCAANAAAAGWANNGAYGGDLQTAVAVCVAESGGQPSVYYCETTGHDGQYPPVTCPGGSYDRGLWQLNSKYQPGVSDACAFRGRCNADHSYRISGDGTDFAPWAAYTDGGYLAYLPEAESAVARLASGTVTSAVFGACLASSAEPSTRTLVAVVTRCGRGSPAQQWAVTGVATATGGTLRQGTRCLTVGSASPTLSTCSGAVSQVWTLNPPNRLRSAQAGLCVALAGTGAHVRFGKALQLAPCVVGPAETWWLP